ASFAVRVSAAAAASKPITATRATAHTPSATTNSTKLNARTMDRLSSLRQRRVRKQLPGPEDTPWNAAARRRFRRRASARRAPHPPDSRHSPASTSWKQYHKAIDEISRLLRMVIQRAAHSRLAQVPAWSIPHQPNQHVDAPVRVQ